MSNWRPLTPSIYHRLALGSVYGVTDVGLVRQSNQDNFLIDPALGLVAVADGMGGHEGGEIASFSALTSLREALLQSLRQHAEGKTGLPAGLDAADPDATWRDQDMPAIATAFEAVEAANAYVYEANVRNAHGDGGGMGTTLTGIWQPQADGPVYLFHVGDSRLYRYRDGRLTQATHDQTLYQQAVDDGATVDLPPRNLLLQALGPSFDVEPELQVLDVAPGEILLLCSDGLFGASSDCQIAAVLAEASEDKLDTCCQQLIDNAKRDGSRDNITAVLIQCRW